MSKTTDIFFELVSIWAKENELYSKQGTIVSVDESAKTTIVSPSDGGSDILDVRLESDENSESKGFFVVPSVGSLVIVTFISPQESFISAWTEIDTVVAKQDQWTFNEGENLGLVKVQEMTDRLNEMESLFTKLQTDFNSWVPVPNDGGAELKAIISSGFGVQPVPNSKTSDFENEAVKH